jgi:hypothetical protein
VFLEEAAYSFYPSEQCVLRWPLTPRGLELAGRGLWGCAVEAPAKAILATDPASVATD